MKKLQDKVAVFVGGGSAVATIALKHFMDEGAKVLLVDVDEKYFDRSRQLRDEYPERIRTFIGACTCQGDMERAMAFAEQEFGGIDILCNYAGFHGGGDITTVLREQWRIAMDVTCLGIYRAVRAAYPYMKKHHYGRIMNFASIGGRPTGRTSHLCRVQSGGHRPHKGVGSGIGSRRHYRKQYGACFTGHFRL